MDGAGAGGGRSADPPLPRATRDFEPPPDAHWQVQVGAPTEGEVICHNDLAPYNTVFRDGLPVAIIDWDFAAPWPPLWDLAFAAWRYAPLYADVEGRGWPAGIDERAARLRLFCDSYGLEPGERAQLVELIERRIRCGCDTLEAWGRAGKPGWPEMLEAGTHGVGALRDLAYVQDHRRVLGAALA